ncbi:helix-turn-helix domain-containing protein [Gemmata sp. G18]|uniref:Helix-turn-helix domain-containing protein n=1 Tax=Gemmata palustris TaxID=2822762 RepID=A0ABS5C1K6_9BACT|nr:helix-turn-helix domain-containing protein [Gemmata palustris]MBP3959874.1 helix-turn-helix domain-containing protein [Gemmata palustris]
MLTVSEVARRFGVSQATVLAWIAIAELKAVNVSRGARSKRPRWRISTAALEVFELARTPQPEIKAVKRTKRQNDVIEFYK